MARGRCVCVIDGYSSKTNGFSTWQSIQQQASLSFESLVLPARTEYFQQHLRLPAHVALISLSTAADSSPSVSFMTCGERWCYWKGGIHTHTHMCLCTPAETQTQENTPSMTATLKLIWQGAGLAQMRTVVFERSRHTAASKDSHKSMASSCSIIRSYSTNNLTCCVAQKCLDHTHTSHLHTHTNTPCWEVYRVAG